MHTVTVILDRRLFTSLLILLVLRGPSQSNIGKALMEVGKTRLYLFRPLEGHLEVHTLSPSCLPKSSSSSLVLQVCFPRVNRTIDVTSSQGYIGGAVLEQFLDHPDTATFEFTVLVRSPEKAEKFKTLGINAVVGSLSDLTLVEKLASEADVVIATVSEPGAHGAS